MKNRKQAEVLTPHTSFFFCYPNIIFITNVIPGMSNEQRERLTTRKSDNREPCEAFRMKATTIANLI